jgi:hypothetical protein
MTWQEIREQYPNRWVVVEAINAYTEDDQRVILELELVAAFAEDWKPAWDKYKEVHFADRWREYYYLHTRREKLNIGVVNTAGNWGYRTKSVRKKTMTWQEIREQYPNRWVVVEALNAYTEGDQRVIPQVELVAAFDEDWKPAWDMYDTVHKQDRWREYYPIHTSREQMNVRVRNNFGRAKSAK